jgi:hypothetical protein
MKSTYVPLSNITHETTVCAARIALHYFRASLGETRLKTEPGKRAKHLFFVSGRHLRYVRSNYVGGGTVGYEGYLRPFVMGEGGWMHRDTNSKFGREHASWPAFSGRSWEANKQ